MTLPRPRPVFPRLAMRLAVTMALSCLPVGVVAYMQTSALEDSVRARAEDGLLGQTLRAAEAEISLIREAEGLVAALAQAVPLVVTDAARCQSMMQRIASLNPEATLVGFVSDDGVMRCSTADQIHDFSDNPAFQRLRSEKVPTFIVSRKGQVSGQSVLAMSHPVFDEHGHYLGYAVISLPHAVLSSSMQNAAAIGTVDAAPLDVPPDATKRRPLFFWTFDQEGNVLTANVDLDQALPRLPLNHPLPTLTDKPAHVFQDHSTLGVERTYAVVPVVEGKLYLMSSWRTEANDLVDQFKMTTYLSPFLMWLAAFMVAGLASEHLVARHVRTLHRAIRNFARGDRRLDSLDLSEAPIELRELGDTYLSMTETITRGEAELEDTVHQKEVLLREVHHRVKNNLQLIASIMNIQIRKSSSPEAKLVLRDLHDRVMSLATIHRGLYQTSGQTDVSAAELLADIARQISALAFDGDRAAKVDLDIDDIRLVPDQAVPLALLLTEALTNAIKHAAKPATVRVELKSDGADAVLRVSNPMPVSLPPPRETGLGHQLMTAFAQQLRGALEMAVSDGGYVVSLRFHIAPLRTGELRQRPLIVASAR